LEINSNQYKHCDHYAHFHIILLIVIIVTYVDDFIIFGEKDLVDKVKKDLHGTFKMEDLGPASYYVGVRLVCN